MIDVWRLSGGTWGSSFCHGGILCSLPGSVLSGLSIQQHSAAGEQVVRANGRRDTGLSGASGNVEEKKEHLALGEGEQMLQAKTILKVNNTKSTG